MHSFKGNPQQKEYKEKRVIYSGCSRHMTGNKCYLTEYEDYDGGFVSFGDGKGRISGKGLTCLFAKATIDESNLWHKRLGHINFKNINKLVKGNLVRGLPSKIFENDHSCVACQKGESNTKPCKAKLVNSISKPLLMLHMDLFSPTNVKSLMKKTYCLVVTDDFSRFSWGIKREFSVARTPQQNGVAERRNRTLIEAARTMKQKLMVLLKEHRDNIVLDQSPKDCEEDYGKKPAEMDESEALDKDGEDDQATRMHRSGSLLQQELAVMSRLSFKGLDPSEQCNSLRLGGKFLPGIAGILSTDCSGGDVGSGGYSCHLVRGGLYGGRGGWGSITDFLNIECSLSVGENPELRLRTGVSSPGESPGARKNGLCLRSKIVRSSENSDLQSSRQCQGETLSGSIIGLKLHKSCDDDLRTTLNQAMAQRNHGRICNLVLYNLGSRYQSVTPPKYAAAEKGDLKTLFEPNEEDEIWKNQQDYNLISWRLFDSCGVHVLLMNTGVAIHMMIEKKYPLTQEMLSRMLNRRLEVDYESEMAFELLRFTRSQLQK
ncbi:putative ribonuclease H-like domain-containing protein [Tanacetum coccineum]